MSAHTSAHELDDVTSGIQELLLDTDELATGEIVTQVDESTISGERGVLYLAVDMDPEDDSSASMRHYRIRIERVTPEEFDAATPDGDD
jgi:hypothetical protein